MGCSKEDVAYNQANVTTKKSQSSVHITHNTYTGSAMSADLRKKEEIRILSLSSCLCETVFEPISYIQCDKKFQERCDVAC